MLQVIFFQLLVPQREVLVVQEVVREVVADVTEDASAVNGRSNMPVPVEYGVG